MHNAQPDESECDLRLSLGFAAKRERGAGAYRSGPSCIAGPGSLGMGSLNDDGYLKAARWRIAGWP